MDLLHHRCHLSLRHPRRSRRRCECRRILLLGGLLPLRCGLGLLRCASTRLLLLLLLGCIARVGNLRQSDFATEGLDSQVHQVNEPHGMHGRKTSLSHTHTHTQTTTVSACSLLHRHRLACCLLLTNETRAFAQMIDQTERHVLRRARGMVDEQHAARGDLLRLFGREMDCFLHDCSETVHIRRHVVRVRSRSHLEGGMNARRRRRLIRLQRCSDERIQKTRLKRQQSILLTEQPISNEVRLRRASVTLLMNAAAACLCVV